MSKYEEIVFNQLMSIANKHLYCINDYNYIMSLCSKRLMSRGVALYGMFYPENELSKYFIYKGKLTTSEYKRNYTYYFDNEDKLRLTERYIENGKLLNLIFYYYHEDLIEIVWVSTESEAVQFVGYVEYDNGKLIKFVESFDVEDIIKDNKKIQSFKEYLFDVDDEYVIKKTYSLDMFSDGRKWEGNLKIKK